MALALFVRARSGVGGGTRWLAIGLLGGAVFLLRENLIGLWLVIGLLVMAEGRASRRWRAALVWLGLIGLGAALVVTSVVLYFALRGVLADLWDQAFLYNLAYSDVPLREHLRAAWGGLSATSPAGLPVMALAGWLYGIWLVVRSRAGRYGSLLAIALIAWPVELLLSSLSGRVYAHYTITWLPAMAILTALAARALLAILARMRLPGQGWVWLGCVLLVAGAQPGVLWINQTIPRMVLLAERGEYKTLPELDYVRQVTAPDDPVLVWGSDVWVNLMAPRRVPTRFVYQYAFFMPGYRRAAMVDDLLADLRADPPALILDTSPVNENILPLDPAARAARIAEQPGADWPALDPFYRFVAQNYTLRGAVGDDGWWVYAYTGPAPPGS